MQTRRWWAGLLATAVAATVAAQEPAWNAAAIKPCDRACLVGILDGHMDAIYRHDPKAVSPLGNGWTPGSGR